MGLIKGLQDFKRMETKAKIMRTQEEDIGHWIMDTGHWTVDNVQWDRKYQKNFYLIKVKGERTGNNNYFRIVEVIIFI